MIDVFRYDFYARPVGGSFYHIFWEPKDSFKSQLEHVGTVYKKDGEWDLYYCDPVINQYVQERMTKDPPRLWDHYEINVPLFWWKEYFREFHHSNF